MHPREESPEQHRCNCSWASDLQSELLPSPVAQTGIGRAFQCYELCHLSRLHRTEFQHIESILIKASKMLRCNLIDHSVLSTKNSSTSNSVVFQWITADVALMSVMFTLYGYPETVV